MEKHKLSRKSLLINFSIFSIYLIPFANKVSFETFPLLLIVCSILIIFSNKMFKRNLDKIQISALLLLMFICLSFLYNLPSNNIALLELIKYLIGPIILFSSHQIIKNLNIKFVYYLSFFLIFLYFLLKFNVPILFNFACDFLEFFIARYDCSNFDNLKSPFLITPEPSYLALFLGFIILIINLMKKNQNYKKNLHNFLIIEFLLLFIILDTQSRIGYIVLFILFFNYFFLNNYFKYLLTILVVIYITFIFQLDKSRTIGRLISIQNSMDYIQLSRNVDSKTLIEQINYSEPTGAIRIIHNLLSVYGFYNSDIIYGHGPGSYSKKWFNDYSNRLNLQDILKKNEVMSRWDLPNKKQYVQNYFFSILHDCGLIVSLLFLYLVYLGFKNIIKSNNKIYYCLFAYIILCFFYQTQITNPMPWLGLSILLYANKKKSFYD